MQRIGLMAVLALVTMAAAAHAGGTHIDFSFGVPLGYGHHHHHHHCRPYYRPTYVLDLSPRPVYVYPQPAYVQPAYVAPTYAAPVAPAQPNWTSRTEPRTNALPASQRVTSTVTIRNPAKSAGEVAFIVDEASEVTLAAGQTQTLTNKSAYTVEFDRGGDYGTARKTLGSGAYEFVVTESGWDLVEAGRVASRPALRKNDLPTLR